MVGVKAKHVHLTCVRWHVVPCVILYGKRHSIALHTLYNVFGPETL